MTVYIAPIVEGQTEDECIPTLLHRVWSSLIGSPHRLQVLMPSRGKRDRLVADRPPWIGPDFDTKVQEASVKLTTRLRRDAGSVGFVLLLLDSEAACPKELAPALLEAARTARSDVALACVLPCRMFENWLIAGAALLGGRSGLPEQLPGVADCEAVNGARWLSERFREANLRRVYDKILDGKSLVSEIDLEACEGRSPSFAKLCRELRRFVEPSPLPSPEPDAAD